MDADKYKLRDGPHDESSCDSSVHPEQSDSGSLSPMLLTSSGSSINEATQNLEAMSMLREFIDVSQPQQVPPVAQSNQNLEQHDIEVSQNQPNPAPSAQEEEPPQDLHVEVPQNQPDPAPLAQEEEPPQEMHMEEASGEHYSRHPRTSTERDHSEIGTGRTRRNQDKSTGVHKNVRNTAASSGRIRSSGVRIGDASTSSSTHMRTRSADSSARGDGSEIKKRGGKIEKGTNDEDDDYDGDDEIDDQNTTQRNSRGKKKVSGSK